MTTITTRQGKGAPLTHTELDSNFTDLNTNKLENAGNVTIAGNLSVDTVTANSFAGDGSQLTGLPEAYGDANVTSLLGSFGSNSVVTTGNVTAGSFSGDGSGLTGLPASGLASVSADTTPELGGNLTGAGFSIGNVSTVEATGNVTAGDRLRAVGNTVYFGSTDANRIVLNATQISFVTNSQTRLSWASGGATSQGNLTLTDSIGQGILNAKGANITGNISATDTVTAAAFVGNGAGLTNTPQANAFATVAANGTNLVADSSSDTLTLAAGNNIVITGNAATDTVTISSTASGGTPGGNTGEIQFNSAGTFGGAPDITYDAGNAITRIGNVQITGNTVNPVDWQRSGTQPNPYSLTMGTGIGGDYSNAVTALNHRDGVIRIIDRRVKGNENIRENAFNIQQEWDYGNTSINNALARTQGMAITQQFINGGNQANNGFMNQGLSVLSFVGKGGEPAADMGAHTGIVSFLDVLNGSTVSRAIGVLSAISRQNGSGNIANGVCYTAQVQSPGWDGTGQQAAYYLGAPGNPNFGNWDGSFNTATAMEGNFWFVRNDADIVRSKLGSLAQFHEYRHEESSDSGSLTIDKLNGQVQSVDLTENITSVAFSNFVRVAEGPNITRQQVDTVTIIFRQDSTGRSVSLPTGTGFRYAGGNDEISTTANSVTMVSVTAITNAANDGVEYLITVSPEFV